MSGYIFDVPALTDAASGWPSQYVLALITITADEPDPIIIPSTVRSRAMQECLTPGQAAELDWFLARTAVFREVPLNESDVPDVEQLMKRLDDVAAAHVALIARREDRTIITSWDRKPMFIAEGLIAEDLP
ncbi:hypothetical protein [Nocardia sp. NPDC052566]|uniref:hypothetical protein n=1 Tax=Nocardia sp. NPDC052566 TaxID=3364330 RepID=UPI0037C6D099